MEERSLDAIQQEFQAVYAQSQAIDVSDFERYVLTQIRLLLLLVERTDLKLELLEDRVVALEQRGQPSLP